ncbi:FAD-dependent oxidoreductase [Streptomyces bullii]|uniref:FAD-dependent oxidoreductase n=1 Tax=Streptomyces bullii TaxID=349910 RepID=A0ABW0UTP1_9ACTN
MGALPTQHNQHLYTSCFNGGRRQGRRPLPLRLLAGVRAGRSGIQQDRPAPGAARHVGTRRTAAALFGFAHARTVRPGFDQAVIAQLAQLFGPAAATPDALYVRNWSAERWTAPSTVQDLADHSLFGHPLYQRPSLDRRLHWASTETATDHAGHIEGAPAAGERAARAVLEAPGGTDSRSVTVPTASR